MTKNDLADCLEVEDDDDDRFFESLDRISSVSVNIAHSSGSDDDEDDDEFDDSRISFASAVAPPADFFIPRRSDVEADCDSDLVMEDYHIWMGEPMSIKERRKLLLQGMGLGSHKELLRLASKCNRENVKIEGKAKASPKPSRFGVGGNFKDGSCSSLSSGPVVVISRSRSDANVVEEGIKCRREEIFGSDLPPVLFRIHSAPSSLCDSRSLLSNDGSGSVSLLRIRSRGDGENGQKKTLSSVSSGNGFLCTIKNLDTGKEFIVNEFKEDGTWNQLSDLETGRQLTMEEFEQCVGYSPIVKELMRRENIRTCPDGKNDYQHGNLSLANLSIAKSILKASTRKNWLKNIKGVANLVTTGLLVGERENSNSMVERSSSRSSSSSLLKVRQHGKSCKELTGLYMCQEIQAHQGSIWSIKFSHDARYLASAGEDRVIHVWKVNDCGTPLLSGSGRRPEDGNNSGLLYHPIANGSPDRRPPLGESCHLERKRRGKVSSSSRKSSIPDYVVMPETIFSLSEKPVCSFQGHLDDVLDLSWSKSQHLLSSSMDKTVRLWDMESKTCLKLFAHNDYVTCIQFNPIDDRYFISGSLDAKVRIWSIPDRHVVDWSDLHEMVTAACYTPDGQGALVGSHKGNCRLYNTTECKLNQEGQIDIHSKKKKSNAKKITGFQFAPGNPSEVLITSADSQIRVFNGIDLIQKFRGFRNTSSQISASFTPDGRYVVCASEDSQVYVWKREELRNMGGTGKNKGLITTRSHEHFHCRDVSVAIPWPGSCSKYEPLPSPSQSRGHNQSHHQQPSMRFHNSQPPPTLEGMFMSDSRSSISSRRNFPPPPKKSFSERTWPCPSRSDSGFDGSSFASISPSRSIGSSSLFTSANSSTSSWRWYDGKSTGSNNGIHAATAWGLVIVTAGLGGEIRIYQNFGLPLHLSRQSNLFGSQHPH
ncbi:uncharacterized protein LOC143851587 [Tasmannia lanceolata]|uniref:uncharacterized protein LOC143851587 n=1 Tax=Tasmannia lanceolata TaxID=3420 RepID=UPI004063146C